MSNRMKKLLSLLAVAAMAVSVFAGCGNTDDDKTPSSSEVVESSVADASSEEVEEEFTYPVTPAVHLTINFGGYAGVETDPNRKLGGVGVFDEPTGVIVEDTGVSLDSGSEDFMLMLISGDLPDIICNNFTQTYSGGPTAAIDEGYIIDLTPYAEYMPNYLAWLEENPVIKDQVYTEDGRLWCFANVEDQSVGDTHGIVLRKDILDALGKEIPTTIDEFYEVLKAVKANYPDMIPYASEMRWMWNNGTTGCISSAFNSSYGYYTIDGTTVEFGMYSDGFKEYLQTLNKWYKEGLIHPDYATIVKGDVRGGLAKGTIFAGQQDSGNSFTSANSCEIEGAEFIMIPHLIKEEGGARYSFGTSGYVSIGTRNHSISTDCEDVIAAIRYEDFMFTEEGHNLYNYGVEGYAWEYDANGNIALTEMMTSDPNKTAGDKRWDVCKVTQWTGWGDGAMLYKEALEVNFIKGVKEGMQNGGVTCPMTNDELTVVNTYKADLESYCQEKIAGLLLGTVSFDEWDNIKKACKEQYHADELLAVYQSAWTRFIQ